MVCVESGRPGGRWGLWGLARLVGKRLEDLARVDNVEDDGEEGVALDAATLTGDVLERAVGEAEYCGTSFW